MKLKQTLYILLLIIGVSSFKLSSIEFSRTALNEKILSPQGFGLLEAIKNGKNAETILAYNEKWPLGYNSTEFFQIISGNKKLKRISFCYIKIDSLTSSIGTLSNLIELSMQGEGITYIPDEIGKLRKLRVLDFGNSKDECGGSPVESISSEIGNCESLEELNLAFSNINNLPNSLKNCKKLRKIDLSFNSVMSDSVFQNLVIEYPKVQFIRN